MGYTAGLMPLGNTWTDRLLVHYLRALRGGGEADAPIAVADGVAPTLAPTAESAAAPHVCIHSKL